MKVMHIVQDKPPEKVSKVDSTIFKQNEQVITNILLSGNEKVKAGQSKSIFISTIELLQVIMRFKTLFNFKSRKEWYLWLTFILTATQN